MEANGIDRCDPRQYELLATRQARCRLKIIETKTKLATGQHLSLSFCIESFSVLTLLVDRRAFGLQKSRITNPQRCGTGRTWKKSLENRSFNPQWSTLKMLRCRAPGDHSDPNCNSLNTRIFFQKASCDVNIN